MSITIQPLEEADVPASVRLELEAFRAHPRTPIMWPRGYTNDLYAYSERRRRKDFGEKESRLMKAIDDETGQIVALSDWTFALDPGPEVKTPLVNLNKQPPSDWPIDGNWECRKFFKKEWERWREEVMGGKPYIMLNILTVEPRFQGRGAGARLLAWGVDQADGRGIQMCLESTPAGLSLYKRFGFEERHIVSADMKQFGYNKPYDKDAAIRIWMTREPRSAEVRRSSS